MPVGVTRRLVQVWGFEDLIRSNVIIGQQPVSMTIKWMFQISKCSINPTIQESDRDAIAKISGSPDLVNADVLHEFHVRHLTL